MSHCSRLRQTLTYVGFCLLAWSPAAPAGAQNPPRADVSTGYQTVMLTGDIDETLTKGWYADLAGNVTPLLGIVFEAGGAYTSISETVAFQGVTIDASADISVHQFMGGVRFNARPNDTVTPFGQVLVGAVRGSVDATVSASGFDDVFFESDSLSAAELALQVGGGMDLRVFERMGVRAGLDYLRVFIEDEGLNALRFRVGVVFPF